MEFTSHLAPFATFIQVIAGIYLLFIYDTNFKRNPLQKYHDKYIRLVQDFSNKYQGFLSNAQLKKIQQYINKKSERWKLFSVFIQRLSLLLFLFSIFLLAYIGWECHILKNETYLRLLLVITGILLYAFMLWLTYNFSFSLFSYLKKHALIVTFFIILIVFFHCDFTLIEKLSSNCSIPLSVVYNLCLCTSTLGILVWVIYLIVLFVKLKLLSYFKIKRLDDDFDKLTNLMFTPLKDRVDNKLSKDLRKRLAKIIAKKLETTIDIDNSLIDDCINTLINEQLENFFGKGKV